MSSNRLPTKPMAYANYLASVEWNEIVALRGDQRATIAATDVVAVSHLYAYAVKVQPLGGCLAEVLDGGEMLSPSFWHPLRASRHFDDENTRWRVRSLTSTQKSVLMLDRERS